MSHRVVTVFAELHHCPRSFSSAARLDASTSNPSTWILWSARAGNDRTTQQADSDHSYRILCHIGHLFFVGKSRAAGRSRQVLWSSPGSNRLTADNTGTLLPRAR